MKRRPEINSILKFLKLIYLKLVKINDTPQRIALGIGLGVFSGILPGTGPLAALFLSFVFRANRASALLGSLLTNTWLSLITFILSLKLGSALMGVNWQDVHNNWLLFLKGFHWLNLFKLSVLKIIFPVIIGYFILALSLGALSYLIILIVLTRYRKRRVL